MLGEVLPARNDAWLNAGPRALIAFTTDNADVKLPFRVQKHSQKPITGFRKQLGRTEEF